MLSFVVFCAAAATADWKYDIPLCQSPYIGCFIIYPPPPFSSAHTLGRPPVSALQLYSFTLALADTISTPSYAAEYIIPHHTQNKMNRFHLINIIAV